MLIDLVHLRTVVAVAEEQHLARGPERSKVINEGQRSLSFLVRANDSL